jgi:hypothetical protein
MSLAETAGDVVFRQLVLGHGKYILGTTYLDQLAQVEVGCTL